MEDAIGRKEHDSFHKEFAERIDAENARQNKRLDLLERSLNHINDLTVSVEKMAVNMSNMLEELKKQGERLETLEEEPIEAGRQIKVAVITSVVGTVVGAAVTAVLMVL